MGARKALEEKDAKVELAEEEEEDEEAATNLPSQDQQHQESSDADAQQPVAPHFLEEYTLVEYLQKVKPDWTQSNIYNVKTKLKVVGIESAMDFFTVLRDKGPEALNQMLKLEGEKSMFSKTLQLFLDYGNDTANHD